MLGASQYDLLFKPLTDMGWCFCIAKKQEKFIKILSFNRYPIEGAMRKLIK